MRSPHSPSGNSGRRPLRIAAEIQRDLPDILRKLDILPQGMLVSITEVEVGSDLALAKVFFSILGGDEEKGGRLAERLLNGKRGAIRTEIAHRLVMRQHPDIRFIYDRTPAHAAKIEQLFKQIETEKKPESDS